jgi:hypothetical protein
MPDQRDVSERRDHPHSPFVPLLILVLAYLATQVFQTTQLMAERKSLADLRARQEKQVQDAKKIRERVEKLAADTQLLANRGNKNARLVVDDLRARGITINPQATPSPGTSAPTTPPGGAAK